MRNQMNLSTTPVVHQWINGKPVDQPGAQTSPVFNPATGAVTSVVNHAPPAIVDEAVAAAANAFPTWSALSLQKRADFLYRYHHALDDNREELARIVSSEHGKVYADAMGEVARGIEVVQYASSIQTLLKAS